MKIVKDKPWRAMSLVVFKSTPIFKRAMMVRHGMFQLYLLKVIKVHARYLGRPWRKTNMGVVSAIYSMVRHHLTDDWAFASDTEKRPWEFRNSENDVKAQCAQFNKNYATDDDEWSATAHIVDDSEVDTVRASVGVIKCFFRSNCHIDSMSTTSPGSSRKC